MFLKNSEEIIRKSGDLLCQMHSRVTYCYVLMEGELEYFLTNELSEEKTVLFSTCNQGMVIGWEALNHPGRFITSVSVKSESARLLKIRKDDYLSQLTTSSLASLCQQLQHLLEISFHEQTDLLSNKVRQRAVQLENYFISQESTLEERTHLLRSSPFFGEFSESHIQQLADNLERREYEPNELIYEQGEDAQGIFILIQGEVSIRRQEGEVYLDLRSISTPGYIFGWSSAFGDPDICRASTEYKTSLYFISTESLGPLLNDTKLGIDFYKMLTWLISNQIQLSYSRYIYLLDDHNLISVKHLIDINRPRLPLPSALHKIPHLLQDISTKPLAFSILHNLHKEGTKQERHLASICLDLLKSEEREMLFMKDLEEVYNKVSNGTPDDTEVNRKRCAVAIRKAFEHVSYHLEGEENLPTATGHGNVFIYNHLLNHTHYTLNNKFQLTLDSHFLSSVILDRHYGDPGIRTVRYGRSYEYGHQDYYDNLGYINVYTRDSDLEDEESRNNAKERFYETANTFLESGKNLIISPEGISYMSEESPGPFKMGPFNVAMNAQEEPFLVPVVFINFDKRITDSIFYCKILRPFKISDRIGVNQSLKEFVAAYQQEFAEAVAQGRLEAENLFNNRNR